MVDLWASRDDPGYSGDSLQVFFFFCKVNKLKSKPHESIDYSPQTIWSSTKNLTSLAIAMLVDKKLLKFSDRYAMGSNLKTNWQNSLYVFFLYLNIPTIPNHQIVMWAQVDDMMYFFSSRNICFHLYRISKHWPEFGKMGKEEITVADMLRHEGFFFKYQINNWTIVMKVVFPLLRPSWIFKTGFSVTNFCIFNSLR